MLIGDEFRPFLGELIDSNPIDRKHRGTGAPVLFSTDGSGKAGAVSVSPLAQAALSHLQSRSGWGPSGPAIQALLDPARRRFIIGSRGFVRRGGNGAREDLRRIYSALSTRSIGGGPEAPHQVLLLTPLEETVLRERFRTLSTEVDQQVNLPSFESCGPGVRARSPLFDKLQPVAVPASADPVGVYVFCQGKGVAGARVILRPVGAVGGYTVLTNSDGRASLAVRSSDSVFESVSVQPTAGAWSRVWKDVPIQRGLNLELPPLHPNGFDWGHVATQADRRRALRGNGVKVAIVDSGLARHPSIEGAIAGGRCFVSSEGIEQWHNDEDGHGTHIGGIIAAAVLKGATWGYAPSIQMFGLRVFGGPDGGGWISHVVEALYWAADHGCDIANLSLGFSGKSAALQQAIKEITHAGVLCVAAAGNEGGPVTFPARLDEVLAVSAIGKRGTYPFETVHARAEPPVQLGRHYLASFSNRGDQIGCCAPGVAITSTVPPAGFAAWDGTSMACAHVAGIGALALEAAPEVAALPRSAERARRIAEEVLASCIDLGLSRSEQGAGLPQIGQLAGQRTI